MNGSHVVNEYVQSLLNQLTVTITKVWLFPHIRLTYVTKNIITLNGLHVLSIWAKVRVRVGVGLY